MWLPMLHVVLLKVLVAGNANCNFTTAAWQTVTLPPNVAVLFGETFNCAQFPGSCYLP